MNTIDKNKEEIEKIWKEIKEIPCGVDKLGKPSKKRVIDGLMFDYGNIHKSLLLKKARQERIKTSILYCEDEIEFLKEFYEFYSLSKEHVITIRLKQFQTHLTYLKEREIKNE